MKKYASWLWMFLPILFIWLFTYICEEILPNDFNTRWWALPLVCTMLVIGIASIFVALKESGIRES